MFIVGWKGTLYIKTFVFEGNAEHTGPVITNEMLSNTMYVNILEQSLGELSEFVKGDVLAATRA